MKTLFAALFVLLSFSALAEGGGLLNSRRACAEGIFCPEIVGVEYYTSGDGRCGCLTEEDFIPKRTCDRARIICMEDRGETYTTIKLDGRTVGCGCFGTIR